MNETYNFQVNLSGVLDVLSNHLYTTSDVFVRELLQNSIDAITMRREKEPTFKEAKISISVAEEDTLIFSDNGVGLTKDEIHKFLAVIGQSSKVNLVNNQMPQDYIGRFGIGLLSCFMVTDCIVVETSTTGEDGHRWEGYCNGTYTITPIDNCAKGTKVILKATNKSKKYFSEKFIEKMVKHYGILLPVPVYLEEKNICINSLPIKKFPTTSQEDLLYLGEWIFKEEFLAAIPINTPLLQGVAYILPFATDITTIKSGHKIYLKNMLLTQNGDTLLPPWAYFLRCFLNTNTLKPTASRENFYNDELLQKAQEEFSQAIQDYFTNLSVENQELLQYIISIHERGIKSISVWNDELFKIFSDYLRFESSLGLCTGKYIKQSPSAMWVGSVSEFNQLKSLFKAKEELLICGGYADDDKLIIKLIETYDLPLSLVKGDDIEFLMEDLNFNEGQEGFTLLSVANQALKEFECKVELKKLILSNLSTLYVEDKEVKYLRQIQSDQQQLNPAFSNVLDSVLGGINNQASATLYLNYNSQIIKKLSTSMDSEIIKKVIQILYVQALMAGGHPLKTRELQIMDESLLYLVEFTTDNINNKETNANE